MDYGTLIHQARALIRAAITFAGEDSPQMGTLQALDLQILSIHQHMADLDDQLRLARNNPIPATLALGPTLPPTMCDKKIQCIKALRELTHNGLKEAKEAVEAAMNGQVSNRFPLRFDLSSEHVAGDAFALLAKYFRLHIEPVSND